MKIRHLYISPGHNYFGHHGLPSGDHPIVEVMEMECVAGCGVKGDRFFNFKENYKGQITFFSQEVFDRMCAALNLSEKSPGAARRNVVTEGADLNSLIGSEFEIQGVKFRGTAACTPCHWMDHAFAPGAEHFLQNCGGLRAQILSNGRLSVEGFDEHSIPRLRRGVRWQAERDTAFEAAESFKSGVSADSKAVSRPPHSKTLRRFGQSTER